MSFRTKKTLYILFFVRINSLFFSKRRALRSVAVNFDTFCGLPLALVALPNTSRHSAAASCACNVEPGNTSASQLPKPMSGTKTVTSAVLSASLNAVRMID